MAAMTLKCLMSKTATVNSVTLPTAADHIGTGAVVDRMQPANSLSLGQFFSPPLPTQNRVGPRREIAVMRYEPTDVVPAGPVGSVSGTRSCRLAALAKRVARANHPWSLRSHPRLGSDCQSPERTDNRRDREAEWQSTMARMVSLAAATARK
jgi:hypothetical protein